MRVKPAEGRHVRHPVTKQHIPVEGLEVPEETYWIRRILSGDVVLDPAPAPVVQDNPIPDSL